MDTQRTNRRRQSSLTAGLCSLLLLAACTQEAPEPEVETPMAQAASEPTTRAAPLRMHPSWDLDGDGVNDCERDGSCDHTQNYTQPRDTAPRFACEGRLNEAEQLICATPALGLLDQQLARQFAALQAVAESPDALIAQQGAWRESLTQCAAHETPAVCIEAAYRERLHQLRQLQRSGAL